MLLEQETLSESPADDPLPPPATLPSDALAEASLKNLPRKYRKLISKIRDLEAHLPALSDAQLRHYVAKLRAAIRDGQPLEKALPPAFAAVCVVARRHL